MWRAWPLVVVACSFAPTQVTVDASAGDGSPVVAACTVVATGARIDTGTIGGNGGSPSPDLACPIGDLPVGIGFDMSQDTLGNYNDERVAVVAHVTCASIMRDTSGALHAAVDTIVSSSASHADTCDGFQPTNSVPDVDCPAGSVLVGVAGNKAGSSLYNTVSISCARLSPDGQPTAAVTTLDVSGTSTYTNAPQSVTCAPGTAIASFGILSGCGQDELVVRCSTIECR
jgi:hypothetical protein